MEKIWLLLRCKLDKDSTSIILNKTKRCRVCHKLCFPILENKLGAYCSKQCYHFV